MRLVQLNEAALYQQSDGASVHKRLCIKGIVIGEQYSKGSFVDLFKLLIIYLST